MAAQQADVEEAINHQDSNEARTVVIEEDAFAWHDQRSPEALNDKDFIRKAIALRRELDNRNPLADDVSKKRGPKKKPQAEQPHAEQPHA